MTEKCNENGKQVYSLINGQQTNTYINAGSCVRDKKQFKDLLYSNLFQV